LNPEAIVRYSAAIASRRKRVVPVAAVAGVDAATTAAAVAAVATNSLH
jgi:3-polyprenyl-4-hydroxybenzoate decarboxylase